MKSLFAVTAAVLLTVTLLCAVLPEEGLAVEKSISVSTKQKISAKEMMEIKYPAPRGGVLIKSVLLLRREQRGISPKASQ